MQRNAKKLTKFLDDNGFQLHRVNKNRGGILRYVHPSLSHSVSVTPSISDAEVTHIIHNLQRELGVETVKDGRKRNSAQVRDRHAAERERVAEQVTRSKTELAELNARQARQLNGYGAVLTRSQIREIALEVERREREIRRLERLMTEIPSNNEHAGTRGSRRIHRA